MSITRYEVLTKTTYGGDPATLIEALREFPSDAHFVEAEVSDDRNFAGDVFNPRVTFTFQRRVTDD